MKAVVQRAYGPPEVLHVAETERPVPRAGEVLVAVEAAGLGPEVWHFTAGAPYLVRLGIGLRRPRQPIAGRDLAGRVVEVGEGVTDLRPGDEVFGTGFGTFAEFARAKASRLARKPAEVDFASAAVVPVSGQTALQAVRDQARVGPGDRVAVIGAGGGVGAYAVQIAKILGAEVVGVCGPDKVDLVHSLGADRIVDYTREDFTADPVPFDAVIDTAGHRAVPVLRRALTASGTLVIIGSEVEGAWLGGLQRTIGAALRAPFTGHRMPWFISSENRADLETLAGYLADGRLTPVIGRRHPLDEAPKALRIWREGHASGKTVIEVKA
jgi:NADPH:quinone reductase-like Zn-dependent oxidoreductase